jgi:DNA-binding MarR family transcriptional regulator
MSSGSKSDPIKDLADLDKIVHEPRRFAILNALSSNGDLGVNTLRRATGLTTGNLAAHLRKLEDAGLIEIRRRTILRRPYTRAFITDEGRKTVQSHWRRLDDLKEQVERWRPADAGVDDDLSSEEYAALSREDREDTHTPNDRDADDQT